jgi:hypothetical protein
MRKEMLLELQTTLEKQTKNGKLSMLTKQANSRLRDLMKSSVSTSTDHSTSDQECHSKELLSATVPTTFG